MTFLKCVFLSITITFSAISAAQNIQSFKLDKRRTQTFELNGEKTFYHSYTSIPYSYSDWPAFAEKNNIEFSTEEKRLGTAGSSACAHSPACVIVLPFLAVNAIQHYASKERRFEISFQLENEIATVNYHKGSGAFLNANFPERLETYYFPKLGYGFIYFESQKDTIAEEIVEELFSPSSLSDAEQLEHIETLLDFDIDAAIKLLKQNTFRGQNRAYLIQRSCIVVTENAYRSTLKSIIDSIDEEGRNAILDCLSYNSASEQDAILFRPLIQSSWAELCQHPTEADKNLVSSFGRVIEIERKINIEFDIKCQNKDIVVLRKLLRRREMLDKNEWLQILSNNAMSNYAQSNALDTQRGSKNSLVAQLEYSLANTQSLSNRVIERAFDFSDSQIDILLADYYFADLHKTINLPLLGSNDGDIYQRALSLEKITQLDSRRQSYWKNRLDNEQRNGWKRHHLALAIIVDTKFSEAELDKLMKSEEDFYVPKGWQDISDRLDSNNDSSVQLPLLAMQIKGWENTKIKNQFYAINPKSDSDLLLEKAKRIFN